MSAALNETPEQWYQRSVIAYHEAQGEEKRHWERLGFHRTTVRGQSAPLIDDAFRRAMARANVAEADMLEAAQAVARGRKP